MKRSIILLLLWAVSSNAQINTFPYSEDFESGLGGWASASSNFVDSWILGAPNYNVINQAAPGGTMSWYTDTTDYQTSEYSHVMSPQFDFSGLNYPIVSFDIWWDLVTDVDGAVFQSSINGGSSWENVGHQDDNAAIASNWYNHGFLSEGFPPTGAGLQQISHWSGDSTLGSQGWVTASHFLEGLGGESSVMFRFAWANRGGNADRPANNVAFDNVQIVEGPEVDLSVTAVDQAGPCGGGYEGQAYITISNLGGGSATITEIEDDQGNTYPLDSPVVIGPFSTEVVLVSLPLQNPGTPTLTLGVDHIDDTNASNNFASGTFNCQVISGQNHCNDFEGGNGLPSWWVDPESTNSSFILGPNSSNATINTPPATGGTQFWATTNEFGQYNPLEQSAILSNYFNLAGLENLVVAFNLWFDMETDYDGAVMQYSLDGGSTWITLGAQGQGTNWYNASALFGPGAGGQNLQHWNGGGSFGSLGWVEAIWFDLNALQGQENVLFRVAIGSDDIFQDGGIGVDDFCITGEIAAVDTFNIVINEVKGHSDSMVAYTVELFNTENFDIDLEGYSLQIYDGDFIAYDTLTGILPSMGYRLIPVDDQIAAIDHNTISLYNVANGLLDELTLNNIGAPGLNPSEGSFDQNLDTALFRSISRIPNGQDTDNNAVDFALVCPTLGYANMDDQLSCGPPMIVINELDAQPGSIGYTIELYNKSLFDADLNGYQIGVFDGVTALSQVISGTITSQGYMLVPINLANADVSHNSISLFDPSDNFLGQLTVNNSGAILNEIQGSFNELDNYSLKSISRIPNGQNTFDNAVDFKLVCSTLGSENIDSQACNPVGVKEIHKLGLTVYPNPAKDFIIVDITFSEFLNFKVSDAMGRIIKSATISNQGRIDVSALIPGVYSIIATDSNGKSAVGRFIKQ